jgi:hypothetical protein
MSHRQGKGRCAAKKTQRAWRSYKKEGYFLTMGTFSVELSTKK